MSALTNEQRLRQLLISFAPVRDGLSETQKYVALVDQVFTALDAATRREEELVAALEALVEFRPSYEAHDRWRKDSQRWADLITSAREALAKVTEEAE